MVGVPVESQLFLTLPFVGIGLVGYANLNLEASYAGFALTLQVGNLK